MQQMNAYELQRVFPICVQFSMGKLVKTFMKPGESFLCSLFSHCIRREMEKRKNEKIAAVENSLEQFSMANNIVWNVWKCGGAFNEHR
jgi:hypothetical protein